MPFFSLGDIYIDYHPITLPMSTNDTCQYKYKIEMNNIIMPIYHNEQNRCTISRSLNNLGTS